MVLSEMFCLTRMFVPMFWSSVAIACRLAATRHAGSFGAVFHTRSLASEEAIRERVNCSRNVAHFAFVGRFAVASFLAGVRATLGTFAQRLRRIAVQAAIRAVCIVIGIAGLVGVVGRIATLGRDIWELDIWDLDIWDLALLPR